MNFYKSQASFGLSAAAHGSPVFSASPDLIAQ